MTLRVTALFIVLVALLAPSATSGASSQRSELPRTALLNQASLFKQAKWRAMYSTYTARFRRSCPYAKFVSQQRQSRRQLGTRFQIRGIQTRLETARRAILAYRVDRANGTTVLTVTFRDRDVYTLIGSRWYDELDRVNSCG